MYNLSKCIQSLSLRRWLAIACASVAGCGALPTIVPDMEVRGRQHVRMEGARGPLSAQQSKAVLEKLKARGVETNIFDRHLALEEALSGTPLVVGNKVMLLNDGPATYQAMFAAIQSAKDHINMETYIIEDDEIGRRFSDALIEKQQKGVQVNLIYDSVGSLGTPTAFFKRLTDAGIKVLQFNPVNPLTARKGWEVNQRDHRKLLVVDGQIAFLGGINISSVYSSGSRLGASRPRSDGSLPWRDTHVRIEGPVASDFQKMFIESWEKQKGDPLDPKRYFPKPEVKGKDVVRAVAGSPDEAYSMIYATLISAIRSAETNIHVTNAYFAPDPQTLEALKDAVQRGVDVKLILPSKTDSGLIFHAGRSYYDELLRAGVKIYERQGALLHAKSAIIDGVWSTIGSTNLDWRSFLHNYELNAVILGQEFAGQMQTMFEQDLQASTPVTLDQWANRPISVRLKERAARLWVYWL